MKKRVFTSLLLVAAIMLCSCQVLGNTVVGKWSHQENILGVITETIYVFNDDGTGSMKNLVETKFDYAVEEDTLLITTSLLGIKTTTEYTFEFSSGDLLLTQNEKTIVLKRVD